eukprot:360194-Chlamydomonas_euryale.AAC.12
MRGLDADTHECAAASLTPKMACQRVRVRATGSGPNWGCLSQAKQAIKENLQGEWHVAINNMHMSVNSMV